MESQTAPNQNRIYFDDLDVLRFIAAYSLVVFHAFYGWTANFGMPAWMKSEDGQFTFVGGILERVVHNFCFGVDLFFLISGFLITYLLLAEKDKTSQVDVKKFYIRRAFRIWPLYFLLVAMGPLLNFLFNEPEPSSYIWYLLFAGNFEVIFNGYSSAATNHLWSICIEEHFYLICPLLVAFVPRKHLTSVLFSIIFVSILCRSYILTTDNYWVKIYMNTFSRMDVLAIGSLFGYLFYNNKLTFNDPPLVRAFVYATLAYMFLSDVVVYWDNVFLATIKKYFYVLGSGYVMGNFLFNPTYKQHFLKSKKLMELGKMSYGIYMFNPVIVAILIKTFNGYQIRDPYLFVIGLHVLLYIFVVISYKFFEMPFLKLKERFAVIGSSDHAKLAPVPVEQHVAPGPVIAPMITENPVVSPEASKDSSNSGTLS